MVIRMNWMSKFKTKLHSQEMQKLNIIISIVSMILLLFAINPFATDGYEDINDRATLDQRVAIAIASGQTELLIDYSGEDWLGMKNWFKEDFKYNKLIKYIDEFSIYNYDGAKYTYWTYGTKKRVKVVISYKLSKDQIVAVNSFADNYINQTGLRGMSTYDAIKTTHDYLINNYKYTTGANNLYNMINTRQANCYGYTMMNYVILNKLDIPIRTTYGATNNTHIWNVVQIDGQWYYEDVTWDTSNKGIDYMLVSSEKILKDHTIYGNFIVDCPSNYVPTKQTLETNETPNVEEVSPKPNDEVVVPKDPIQENVTSEPVIEDNRDEEVVENKPIATPSQTMDNSSTNSNTAISQKEKLKKLINILNALKNMKSN